MIIFFISSKVSFLNCGIKLVVEKPDPLPFSRLFNHPFIKFLQSFLHSFIYDPIYLSFHSFHSPSCFIYSLVHYFVPFIHSFTQPFTPFTHRFSLYLTFRSIHSFMLTPIHSFSLIYPFIHLFIHSDSHLLTHSRSLSHSLSLSFLRFSLSLLLPSQILGCSLVISSSCDDSSPVLIIAQLLVVALE